jgi:hypothetical protein
MTAIPADHRVPTAASLSQFTAPVGTHLWVEDEAALYVAVSTINAASNATAGLASSSEAISWQPDGLLATAYNGGKTAVKGIAYGSGFVSGGYLRLDYGEYAAGPQLTTNNSTLLYSATLSGLTASNAFHATLNATVILYESNVLTNVGSIELTTDLYIVTSSGGVATVTVQGSVSPDVSRLPAGLTGAIMSVAAATGGFSISATRPTGVTCSTFVDWTIKRFSQLT